MTTSNLFTSVNLNGEGIMRGVTLSLPANRVRNLLPASLELGKQTLTSPGTHPVVLFFHDLYRGNLAFPNLIPSLTYYEHSIGVPFTYISAPWLAPGSPGPYYYMPRLYLNSLSPMAGGRLWWGFAKDLGQIEVTSGRYTVSDLAGRRLTSLGWDTEQLGEVRPVTAYPNFEPVRQMLNQPLISLAPLGVGPFLMLSHFDKNWDVATLRPLRTSVEVDLAFLPGYECARYPASGWAPGIDEVVTGSYELRSPWRLSLPYPPMFAGVL